MKKMVMLVLVVLSAGLARMGAQTSGGAFVARLDPALDEIISADAKLETVRSDFGNAEGPNWIQQGKNGYLVFTDIVANVIYKMTPDGKASVLVDHSAASAPNASSSPTRRRASPDACASRSAWTVNRCPPVTQPCGMASAGEKGVARSKPSWRVGSHARETPAAAYRLDEIQRGKGHRFWTVLSDVVHGEVIGLRQDRSEVAATARC
jgi:hypothetical protein